MLGLRVLAVDTELQTAIRTQLTLHVRQHAPKGPSAATVIASLRAKERKILDLYYADKIDQDDFAHESTRLTTQRIALQSEIDALNSRNEPARTL